MPSLAFFAPMTLSRTIRLLGAMLGLLMLPCAALAHGDEPHGAEAAAAPAARTGASVASALSQAFEAVLVVPVRAAADPLHATLYLADFATNAPISGATLALSVPGRRDTLRVTATGEPGVYTVEGPALPVGALSFTLRVEAGGQRGLMLLSVPAPAPAAEAEVAAETAENPLSWGWLVAVAALGLVGAVWLAFLARQRRRSTLPSASPSP